VYKKASFDFNDGTVATFMLKLKLELELKLDRSLEVQILDDRSVDRIDRGGRRRCRKMPYEGSEIRNTMFKLEKLV
jgi:hypothetical protein